MSVLYVPPSRADREANIDYAMTLEEIGNILGVTRERVRQIEKKALAKLGQKCMPQLLEMRAMANELRRRTGNCEHGVIR